MRRLIVLFLCALVAAGGITLVGDGEPFTQRLVKQEAADALPQMRDTLAREPAAVNAVFLDYAGNETLLLNARLALIRYPAMAREILPLYGTEPEFRAVLSRYGPAALPPIHYFLHHRVRTLRLMRAAGNALEGVKRAALRLWEDPPPAPQADSGGVSGDITPVQRGWYAVGFIRDEGHDFLGQFVVAPDGTVKWIQTERALEGTTAFFTSGIRSLETKLREDRAVGVGDWFWASVDVVAAAGAAKVLRVGRTAETTAEATSTVSREALLARSLARGGRIALRTAKYGAPLALGYVLIRHPSLISSLAGHAARWVGVPVWSMQLAVWTMLLLPLLYLGSVLARLVLRPALVVLRVTIRLLDRIDGRRGGTRGYSSAASPSRNNGEVSLAESRQSRGLSG